MEIKERNRHDVEERLKSMGDYMKIHYLTACLKHPFDFDTKRFALVKLGELYENKKMFLEAGKMMMNAAPINTTFHDKMDDFLKAAELFAKAGNFDEADIAFEKAIACGNDREKINLKQRRIELYKNQAIAYFDNDKRHSALIAYEKLLSYNLSETERREAQSKLLYLYEKLGKIKEYGNLRRAMI